MEKAWIVAIDMGYGHQRAAFALKDIAYKGEVLSANNYSGIPKSDRSIWEQTREFYEFTSKFKKVPIIGGILFGIMDKIQEIKPFYPKKRPLVPPTAQVRTVYKLIETREWGRHLIKKLNQKPIPLIATFSTPAFMAEYWGYKGPIYLLVTDSDASRAWAPLHPKKTKIQYLAPSKTVAERLVQYGIPSQNITQTSFPLPEELTNTKQARNNLKKRLARLDPERQYFNKYANLVKEYVGTIPAKVDSPPTITFAIGGAGAQQELGDQIIRALTPLLKQEKLRLCMAAGTHADAVSRFKQTAKEHGLSKKEITIMNSQSKDQYFKDFTTTLHNTDILWTKPSEMSFYAALGIPLILSDPIGSQEEQNRKWLLQIGSAIKQLDPLYAQEWIMDYLNQGLFAEAAMQGFIEMTRKGTENIKKTVLLKRK